MLYLNDGASPRRPADANRHDGAQAIWVDLLDPTEDERSAAERMTGLRVPTRDDVAEIESSSRVYSEGAALYMSMPYSFLAPDRQSNVTPVGFVLSDRHLLTLRYMDLPAFNTYAESYGHAGSRSSYETFTGLAEAIVDRLADVLERVATELDHLSKTTFNDAASRRNARRADQELRQLLNRVGRAGDTLGNLRDSVLGIGRLIGYGQGVCDGWTPAALKGRLATLKADIASLNDYDQQLSNKVQFLLDAVLGFINIEQNNGVKVLTIASVVGIPPTFVVGLYGMNFKNMPEYDWHYGYAFGWAMILVSIVVPLVWFRVKGWL